jgi:glutamyl-tRNA reductase
MPYEQPWVMGVQADTADANDRDDLARSVRERIAAHSDWILLNTCHRVELYGFGTPPELDARLKVHTGEGAVRHLIRVAAGLESAIIGEDEVLHQVREAVGNARAGRTLDGRLLRLFETAIAAGRRARAGRTAASGNLAQRAVAWLGEKSSLVGHTVLVAGAGRMGSSLAHSAKLAGADIVIASRDATRTAPTSPEARSSRCRPRAWRLRLPACGTSFSLPKAPCRRSRTSRPHPRCRLP